MKEVVGLLLIAAAPLAAQYSAARLQGTVKDASGAVIPHAQIGLRLAATGVGLRAESNEAGLYVFPAVQPGKHHLTVEAAGMETWQGDVDLMAGQEAAFDPVLKVAGTSTTLTVAGDVTPMVTDAGPTLSNIVERQRIEQLPIDGRQFYNLMVLTTPGLEEGNSGPQRPEPFGLRVGIVDMQQDGASLQNDNTGMITWAPPGLDTVQQYNVEMSVASARYEKPVTGILSTRSGNNEWHGGLFYTGRNNGFGLARARQDNYTIPPQLIRNEFGVSQGGQVRIPRLYSGKDRTFFFFSVEGLRLRQATTFSQSVPTAAMRQGDFSQLTGGAGNSITLYDPWSTAGAAQNYSRVPFPNNQLPIGRLSPLAKYAYSVLPLPTFPSANPATTSNWYGPNPSTQSNTTYTVRIDHRIGDRDQVFGRYSTGGYNLRRKYNAGTNTPTSDDLWNFETAGERLQTPMATWNHTFSPRFFVETMGVWSNGDWSFCQECIADTQNNLARFGLPNPFNRLGAPELDNAGFGYTFYAVGPRAEDTQKYVAEQNYTLISGPASTPVRLALSGRVAGCDGRSSDGGGPEFRQQRDGALRSDYRQSIRRGEPDRRQLGKFLSGHCRRLFANGAAGEPGASLAGLGGLLPG
jgi:hypothetical protein